LIELLVVVSIFTIISVLTIASNASFGEKITLETLAYDVALSVRQSQVYGIAVRRFGLVGSDFNRGYGMHFDLTSANNYELFADTLTGNGIYDEGELVEATTIQGGYHVADLCVRPHGSITEDCSITELNILFKRPEPDAYIRGSAATPTYELGRVILQSPRGTTADIVVELSGQISVQ
jgi:hypothetical protein